MFLPKNSKLTPLSSSLTQAQVFFCYKKRSKEKHLKAKSYWKNHLQRNPSNGLDHFEIYKNHSLDSIR